MRRTVIIWLVMLLGAGLYASVGKIDRYRGEASVLRGGETFAAVKHLPLEAEDVVETGGDGWVRIRLSDDTIITAGKNARLEIKEYLYDDSSDSKASLGFAKGVFKTLTGKIGKIVPEKFKVKTPNATIGIRGTEFYVSIGEGREEIVCTSGMISVRNRLGEIEVEAGAQTFVTPSAPPAPPAPASSDRMQQMKIQVGAKAKKVTASERDLMAKSSGGMANDAMENEDDGVGMDTDMTDEVIVAVAMEGGSTPTQTMEASAEAMEDTTDSQLNQDKTDEASGIDPDTPDSPPDGPPPGTQETLYSDPLMSYGYWMEGDKPVGTFVSGTLTDDTVIDSMVSQEQQAHYSGGIAAISGDEKAEGTVELDVNFGASTFTGNMDFQTQNGPQWQAEINSGELRGNGLGSTDISAAAGSEVQNIDGSMSGNFFGPNAEAVGGDFALSGDAGSAEGSFGGTRQ